MQGSHRAGGGGELQGAAGSAVLHGKAESAADVPLGPGGQGQGNAPGCVPGNHRQVWESVCIPELCLWILKACTVVHVCDFQIMGAVSLFERPLIPHVICIPVLIPDLEQTCGQSVQVMLVDRSGHAALGHV